MQLLIYQVINCASVCHQVYVVIGYALLGTNKTLGSVVDNRHRMFINLIFI